MVLKYHARSISLPSRSHPTTIKVDEELNNLKTWEATSTPTSDSVRSGLFLLEDVYVSLDELLNMPSTQMAVSQHQADTCVEELLDGSVRVLDTCGITRDILLQIKENVGALHSAVRRRKGDSSVEKSVAEYEFFTKKMKKNVKTLITDLKHMESRFGATPLLNLDDQMASVIRVIREAIVMNVSIFQSLLAFLVMPKEAKWFVVAKWMHKGTVEACEEKSEMVNELKSVESVLNSVVSEGGRVEKMKIVHARLEALEMAIESLETGLEIVFRRLIKTRAPF
ncbi:uncharacterized protein LOC129310391 [Prosopis cineraria]|uniref:uncharacterized protein LOC129310391 n=1 Tax=Prosopis cineraria TaxID=364024 RepID=UPI00241032AE|nr:uncharacterized protein LOC129310391 [Prosopis cineraria]